MKHYFCVVCGKPVSKESYEPRFGYYICKEHENIPPAFIDEHIIPKTERKNYETASQENTKFREAQKKRPLGKRFEDP